MIKKSLVLLVFLFLVALILISCNNERISKINETVLAGPSKIETLEVLTFTPTGTITEESQADMITVSFNQAMVPLTVLPEEEPKDLFLMEPSVPGKYRWMGTSTLTFIPDEPLPFATTFKVTVPKGFKALTGAVLEKDISWSFNTMKPAVEACEILDGYALLPLEGSILLLFNQPVEAEKAGSFIKLYYDENKEVSLNITGPTDDLKMENMEPEDVLIVKPEEKFKLSTLYTLKILEGMPGKTGDLSLEKTYEKEFNSENVFKFEGLGEEKEVDPESDIYFKFTNPVEYGELIKNIKFEPALEVPEYYARYGNYYELSLYLALLAQTEYKVKISKDIKDVFGNTLKEDVNVTFKTGDYSPSMFLEGGVGSVEANSSRTFPVSFMNLDRVQLQMANISKEELIPFFSEDALSYGDKYNGSPEFFGVDRIWDLKLEKNSSWWLPVELDEVLKDKETGFVFIQLDAKNKEVDEELSKAFVQVTNLGITGKFSQTENLIAVHTLDKALPVENADIEIRDDYNKVLWTGKTGSDGTVVTPGWGDFDLTIDDNKMWVFASLGEDICVINSSGDWSVGTYSFGFSSYQPSERDFEAYTFTDKGVYRGGEDIHIKGVMRERIDGEWKISSVKLLNLRVYNSRDEEIYKKNVNLSGYGSFSSVVSLPEDVPTGRYYLELVGDTGNLCYKYFQVEDYKAAGFEVTVKSDKDYYTVGETFTGSAKGWYLFGAPMKRENVKWYYYLQPTYYYPPGHEGYDFAKDFWSDYGYRDAEYLGNGNGELKEDGTVPLSVELLDEKKYAPYILEIQAEVTTTTRESLSGYKEVMVHPGEYYIGVKPSTRFMSVEDTQKFQVITTDPDGKVLTQKDVKIEILNRQWNSVRKEGLNGKTEWTTEKVDEVLKTFDIKSGSEPVSLDFKPEKAGFYIIKASGIDDKKNDIITEAYFYVTGGDYIAWARYNDDRVDLITDKKEYKPGDTAKILVKSPYEKARALVTVERETIMESFFVDLEGSADTIELPIKSEHLPNVYVSVILYQGRVSDNLYSDIGEDLGKPSFKIGYVNLPVLPDEKRLNVTLDTDKEEYGPGEDVRVKIHVENPQGKGTMAEVTLWAVDVGVLNLTAFETPDYFSYFYGERSLWVDTSETRLNIIGQRNYGQKGGNPGGGGGMTGVTPRENFVATPYFNPSIITDEKGDATIKFTLPDNLTTFKIMAAVHTKDASFGKADKRIVSTKPLVLKPSMPSFVRLGDKFKAGVMVFNGTDKEGEVTVSMENKGFTFSGNTSQSLVIAPGEEKEVLFSFEAEEVCEGELVFSSQMGDYSDAILKKISVEKPVLTETVATSGVSEGEKEEALLVPETVDNNTGHLEITTSSTAMVGLKGGIEYLVNYPYLCQEQKISRILPYITGEELINAFDLCSLKGEALRKDVQEKIQELYDNQTSSGGFTLWEDSPCCSPFLSAYTIYALALAKKAGYSVDENVFNSGTEYLKEVLRFTRDDERWGYPYSEDEELTTKAFVLYILYLIDKGEPSYVNNLYEARDKMSLFGRTMLLRTIHLYGKDSQEKEVLIKELMNYLKLSPTSAHFEERDDTYYCWIFGSNVRTTALILTAFLEVDAKFPHEEKVVKWLVESQKDGRWDTTQENIFAFDALQKYFLKYEKAAPDFEGKVFIDGKELFKEYFKGRDLNVRQTEVSMEEISKGKDMPLIFDKKGIGRFYYTIRLQYAPLEPKPARDEGITVFKVIEPLEEGTADGNNYKAGKVYKVTISVVTPQERYYVVVNDPIPAGFEPLQESFATENMALLRELYEIRDEEETSWWGYFNHFERYEDKVLLFADQLDPGEHNFTYLVRAMHYGTYEMPHTKAELMYEPEVFGYSKKDVVNIVE